MRKTSQDLTNLKATNQKLTFKDVISEDLLYNEAKNKIEKIKKKKNRYKKGKYIYIYNSTMRHLISSYISILTNLLRIETFADKKAY